ncbi:hypothetical protein HID58_083543, partial [Brassica napus]
FMAMKPNGKSIVSSGYDEKVMFFKDVTLVKKTLIGLEMLLIDERVRTILDAENRGIRLCNPNSVGWNSPVSYVCSSFKPPLVVSSNIVSHRCINEIKCKK